MKFTVFVCKYSLKCTRKLHSEQWGKYLFASWLIASRYSMWLQFCTLNTTKSYGLATLNWPRFSPILFPINLVYIEICMGYQAICFRYQTRKESRSVQCGHAVRGLLCVSPVWFQIDLWCDTCWLYRAAETFRTTYLQTCLVMLIEVCLVVHFLRQIHLPREPPMSFFLAGAE